MTERSGEVRKPGCIYRHPHDHECRNQDDMREPTLGVSTDAEVDADTTERSGEAHNAVVREFIGPIR